MSKMPAKKRSCFQITSVTQAQVAAVGAADDTESLDDPDESQAEDVSGMYEASRSEYEPACERSSSDEALNNVAEATVNAPQIRGGPNQPGTSVAAGSGLQCQPAAGASPGVSANTAQPAPAPGTGSVSCSSRFRVIKLDHGTGEPFRRGRWTCTEFYEKDSESSHAGRTDSIRHASVTLDPAADRDSGLGPSVGTPATLSGPGLVSMAEGSQCSLLQQQVVHQSYSSQQHGGSASATHSFSGGNPAALASQPSFGQNGLPHAEVHTQNSPMMPPSYPPQQPVPGVHPITSQPSGPEYYQQTGTIPPDLSGGQPVPMSGLSGHVPSPVMPPASGPSQVGDVCVPAQAGPAALAPLQHPQTIGFGVPGGPMLPGGPTPPHQTTSQYAPAAQAQPIGHTASSGVQNVPAAGAGSSVPGAVLSASSATMPNVTISLLPLGLMAHSKPPEALGVPGLPAAGFGQVEASGGRKSEGAVVAQSPVVSGREAMKPFMPETLQFTTPSVTSLFGIHIPVDGEEDSASGTNIVAIDNKIEQAMDLVKSHLMYAVREEVEVLKEQIKELFERNSVLERENAVLKSLANSEQLSQLSAQTGAAATPGSASTPALQPQSQTQPDGGQQPQPNVTSA